MLAAALSSLSAMSLGDALRAIRECGLQGVEIEHSVLTASRAEFNQLQRYGLRATTIDASMWDPLDAHWRQMVLAALDASRELGSSILIVSAGDDLGIPSRREQIERQLRHAAEAAEERGQSLALETLSGLCADTRGMVHTIERLCHKAVRLNFDIGRYLQLNSWSSGEVALQRMFGHLASVRLTNFTVGVEPQEFPPLGQGGDVDCSRTWQILGGLQFAGPCTIAFHPFTRKPPTPDQCRQWLRQSVEHLRGCGWFDRLPCQTP